jgi:hypothetical protein
VRVHQVVSAGKQLKPHVDRFREQRQARHGRRGRLVDDAVERRSDVVGVSLNDRRFREASRSRRQNPD